MLRSACRIVPCSLVVLSWFLISGCDSTSEPPPLPPVDEAEANSATSASLYQSHRKSSEIALILPAKDTPDYRLWERIIQVESGKKHESFVSQRPSPSDPPTAQADLVRDCAKRGVKGILVIPDEHEAELAKALEYARDQGTAVLTLTHAVKVEGKPIPAIVLEGYEKTADALLKAALDDAKEAGFPANAPGILLIRRPGDAESSARLAAIEAAIKKANVNIAERVYFDGLADAAQLALDPVIMKRRDAAFVFADEDQGTNIIVEKLTGSLALEDDDPARFKYSAIGFIMLDRFKSLIDRGIASAIADRKIIQTGKLAVRLILDLAEGKTIADRTVVEPEVLRRTHKPSEQEKRMMKRPY
jgi:ABC-type sugar transport system substrate-binding protein